MSGAMSSSGGVSTTISVDSGSSLGLSSFPGAGNPSVSDTNSGSRNNFSLSEIAHNITKNKKLDNLFNYLWEETNDEGNDNMKEKLKTFNNLKRKASVLDSKSEAEGLPNDNNSDTVTSEASKLSKDNALLTQLLSKRSNTDIVVNTLSTIQPSGIPQPRFPSNLPNKLLKVNPSSFTTNSTSTDAKRTRTEGPSSSGQLSTLEHALRMPKKDLSTSVSSSTPFDAFDIGQNSNSGISNISDSSVSSQLTELTQILQQNINSGSSSTNLTEVNLEDNPDPLLAQILQQAQDLQQDMSSGFSSNNQNVSQSLPVDSGISNSAQTSQSCSNSGLSSSFNSINSSANSTDLHHNQYNLIQTLEAALQDSTFNLDALIPSPTVSSIDEQLAIERIEKELMMTDDLPPMSKGMTPPPGQMASMQSRMQAQSHPGQFMQSIPRPNPSAGNQMQDGLSGNQMNCIGGMRNTYPNQSAMGGSPRSLSLPGYNSPAPPIQSFPSQGPRLPHPTGM